MRRAHRLPCFLLTLCLPGCFSTPDLVDDTHSGETEGEETGGHGTDGSSTDGPSTDTNDTDSSGDPVCGDGVVEGDEVCDDGVNDGSYGGCLEDCSGPAGYCGDGVVNGPEVCDDGINDDSYDGCAPDCASLGPHCGDGIVQEPEMCDEGENNENGTGCNVDCVTSGTLLETWESDMLHFCSGARVTPPVFREDGNVLVAGGGFCQEGDRMLLEFSPELELLESDALVVGPVPTNATMIGSDWILSAFQCNYIVAENGGLTEVCGDGWLAGGRRIEPLDDDGYLTADEGGQIARHPAGNPAQADDPTWSVTGTGDGNPGYSYFDATFGDDGSVVIACYQRTGASAPYTLEGCVRRLTAAGSSAGTWVYPEIDVLHRIRRTADGGYVGWRGATSEGDVGLVKLSPGFELEWTAEQFEYIRDVQVDAAGHIIVDYLASGTPNDRVDKLTASGEELWSLDVTRGRQTRLGIDASDTIFRATPTYDDTLLVQKISP